MCIKTLSIIKFPGKAKKKKKNHMEFILPPRQKRSREFWSHI